MSWRALAWASSAAHLAAAAVVPPFACAALTSSTARIRRAAQGRDGSQAIASSVRLFPRTQGPAHAACVMYVRQVLRFWLTSAVCHALTLLGSGSAHAYTVRSGPHEGDLVRSCMSQGPDAIILRHPDPWLLS